MLINALQERDELTVKIEELEKTIEENTAREAELQKAADQARTLKDEVDILREDAAKVSFIVIKYEKFEMHGYLFRYMRIM